MADRLDWLKDKVVHNLSVSDKSFDQLLEQQTPQGKSYYEELLAFFDSESAEAAVALFFAEETEVEGAAPAPSPEPEPAPAEAPAAEADVSAEADEGEEGQEKPKEGEEGEAPAPPEGGGEAAPADPPAEGGEAEAPKEGEGEGEAAPAAEGGEKPEGEEGAKPEGEEGEAAPAEEEKPQEQKAPEPPAPAAPTTVVTLHCVINDFPELSMGSRSMYFVKGPMPVKMAAEMDKVVEYGTMSGPSLVMLEQVLNHVYMPLMNSGAKAPAAGYGEEEEEGHTFEVADLSNSLYKFLSQVRHAVQQVAGEVRLQMPTVVIEDEAAAAADTSVIADLESSVNEWTQQIQRIVEQEMGKAPTGKGPLAEIEFWRSRSASLSTLYEQLNLPHIKRVIRVLEQAANRHESEAFHDFDAQLKELSKLHIEAKDNVKFLSTLERHFKSISQGSLPEIADTIPPMMGAIRMVWVISRHYNTDERMVPLMERIAFELAERVAAELDVKHVFRMEPHDAKKKIQSALNVLEKWRETYFKVRQKIEESGRDQRWEFDRKRLFDRTEYMATCCQNIHMVAQVLEDFNNILGPELKAVTGDSQGIDDVLRRVEGLVVPLETVPFDIFDRRFQASWEAVMHRFNEDVAKIEDATKTFINESFKKLRSAEGAFDLLQKFKHIKTRDSINKQMMDKFSDILGRYKEEVQLVNKLFDSNQEMPPTFKNQPPIAGAIAWSKALFFRIKKSIIRFQSYGDMMAGEEGQLVTKYYVQVGRQIRTFETSLFEDWKVKVEDAVVQHLKNPILREVDGRIVVNFNKDLQAVIREAKYLDRMGLPVPENALNVALQEEKYHEYVENLKIMLGHYHTVVTSLTPSNEELLRGKLYHLGPS